jgi:hypothetical protein
MDSTILYLKPNEEIYEEIIANLIRDRNEIENIRDGKKKKLDFDRKYFILLSILSVMSLGIAITSLILDLQLLKLNNNLSCKF